MAQVKTEPHHLIPRPCSLVDMVSNTIILLRTRKVHFSIRIALVSETCLAQVNSVCPTGHNKLNIIMFKDLTVEVSIKTFNMVYYTLSSSKMKYIL